MLVIVYKKVLGDNLGPFFTNIPPKTKKNIHPPTKNRQYKKTIDIKFKKYKKFKLLNRKKKENRTNCRII